MIKEEIIYFSQYYIEKVLSTYGGIRGLVVKVLDSKFEGCEFKTHTGHG